MISGFSSPSTVIWTACPFSVARINLWLTNRYEPGHLKVYSATVTERLDASAEILKILDVVEGKLAAFLAIQRMAGAAVGEGQLERSPVLIAMVMSGELGYWLFVGEKRE